jgi:hypothetical protein
VASSNAEALDAWLAKTEGGRAPLLVQLARSLAAAVDADTAVVCGECRRSGANAALWREYRTTVAELVKVLEADDGGQAALLELVRTPVRDTTDTRARNAGAGGRGGRGDGRSAADAVATAGRGRRPRAR